MIAANSLGPNVTTPDRMAGFQTGALLDITNDGCERLHN